MDTIEPVGNEAFLNLRGGDCELVLRLSPRNLPQLGDTVHLGHNPEHMHFFDPESGRSLRA